MYLPLFLNKLLRVKAYIEQNKRMKKQIQVILKMCLTKEEKWNLIKPYSIKRGSSSVG